MDFVDILWQNEYSWYVMDKNEIDPLVIFFFTVVGN